MAGAGDAEANSLDFFSRASRNTLVILDLKGQTVLFSTHLSGIRLRNPYPRSESDGWDGLIHWLMLAKGPRGFWVCQAAPHDESELDASSPNVFRGDELRWRTSALCS